MREDMFQWLIGVRKQRQWSKEGCKEGCKEGYKEGTKNFVNMRSKKGGEVGKKERGEEERK